MTDKGLVIDSAGYASLNVWSPSYHFREALKASAWGKGWGNGQWSIRTEYEPRQEQRYWFHNAACKAALEIWRKNFPNEAFSVDAHGD